MFTSISWQQYLLAVFSLATVYYGAILFLYYRVEIALFFDRKKDISPSSETQRFPNRTILGEARAELNVVSVTNEELLFNSEAESN